MDTNTPIECGEQAAKEFLFDKEYTNLNHGSYGSYPNAIRSVFRAYQDRTEAKPDAFVRYEYRTQLLNESRSAIAKYLHAAVDCCVFVPNTSTGIDTILRNLTFAPGDVVICFATLYRGFVNTLQYLSERSPLEVRKIDYVLPVTDDEICNAFEDALKELKAEGKVPKIAIFDTICSEPGVCMPFERLTKLCRLHSVLSCVDGAHGVGHLPLDLSGLDPDFFVSNCHKWLYIPRACAVLYVPQRNQHLLRATMPVSFQFAPLAAKSSVSTDTPATSNFVANFSSVGTLDDNPCLCVPAALAWRSRLRWGEKRGEDAIIDYMRELARQGGQLVSRILHTEVLENHEGTLGGRCNFANVRLPVSLPDLSAQEGYSAGRIMQLMQWIMRTMIVEYSTAVYVLRHGNALWARLSAQIYLTLTDFESAGHKLKTVCERADKGEWE